MTVNLLKEKHCTLIFDELKIKHTYILISMYLDLVEDYENLGSKGRTNKLVDRRWYLLLVLLVLGG